MSRLIVLTCLVFSAMVGAEDATAPEELVNQFIAAYNEQNIPAMLTLVADEIRSMGIDNEQLDVWTTGKGELEEMLLEMFSRSRTSRSIIVSSTSNGDYVSVLERAEWKDDSEMKMQCAMSMYEIRDGSILNVWYFSAQPCER